jgi:hypothetical protein
VYIPIPRKVEFICAWCGLPGVGQPGTKTHPGLCRRQHRLKMGREYSRKLYDRKKNKPKQAEPQAIQEVSYCESDCL